MDINILFNTLKNACLYLNSDGIVVSMADRVAIICNNLFSFGEVKDKLVVYKIKFSILLNSILSKISYCFFIFICNLSDTNTVEKTDAISLIEFSNEIFRLVALAFLGYAIYNLFCYTFSDNKGYYLKRFVKYFWFYGILYSFFVATSNRFYEIKVLDIGFLTGGVDKGFLIYVVILIPLIVFMLSILTTVYNTKIILNNNDISYFENTLLYFLM